MPLNRNLRIWIFFELPGPFVGAEAFPKQSLFIGNPELEMHKPHTNALECFARIPSLPHSREKHWKGWVGIAKRVWVDACI